MQITSFDDRAEMYNTLMVKPDDYLIYDKALVV